MNKARAVRAVVCSPQAATRAGVRTVLEEENIEVCADVEDAVRAMEAVRSHGADCCVIDSAAGDMEVAVAKTAAAAPDTAVVVLAESPNEAEFLRLLHVGATGYLAKDMDINRLGEAVMDACAGVPAIPRRFMAAVVEAFRDRPRPPDLPFRLQRELSRRECDVLEGLQMGEPTAAIAARLSISPVTVRRHLSSLLKKLGAPDRQAALDLIAGETDAPDDQEPAPRSDPT